MPTVRITSELADRLFDELFEIRRAMLAEAARLAKSRQGEREEQRSQENLVEYMALRQRDLRPLQRELERLGLSSLGRAEAHALASVDAVLGALGRLGTKRRALFGKARALSFDEGRELLATHANLVLGPAPQARSVRIMVTMPSEAASDYTLVREMVRSGMDIARINCAHDDEQAWARMIANVERAQRELQRSSRILMDLGGPKLRTSHVTRGPRVAKISPRRDEIGRVIAPARVLLSSARTGAPSTKEVDAILSLPDAWLSHTKAEGRIRFRDLRGKERELRIVGPLGNGVLTELLHTAYVSTETKLSFIDKDELEPASVLDVPSRERKLELRPGDHLRVVKEPSFADAKTEAMPSIGCTLPQVFDKVREGDRIWFDDGKIGGVIAHTAADAFEVKITQAGAAGSKLGADKGINLPDTDLDLPFLSDKDRADLRFIAKHAHVVGLSFVQRAEDLEELSRELSGIGADGLGVVIKVEKRQAFEHLPELLLTAIGRWPVGVMIARGDLAIEMGYERLAEVQEEILWISEAAHAPVIWATAVLETLAKKGIPSRAEITDAAMSQRAECVMLNKGPCVLEAIRVLDDILRRMDAHQRKKTSFLRPLQISKELP